MSASNGLRGRVQRLEEHTASGGVVGIVTPRDGMHSIEDEGRLREHIAELHRAGYSSVYVAHLGRKPSATDSQANE